MIDEEKFAEHVKMIIDQDKAKHDYFYELAAALKANSGSMARLRDAIEEEFEVYLEAVDDLDDSEYLSSILNKVYRNSTFKYHLTLMIWNDERVEEMVEEMIT